MTKKTYPYLREAFSGFVRETLESIQSVKSVEEALKGLDDRSYGDKRQSLDSLCRTLDLTKEEFAKEYFHPWEALSPEQAIEVAKYWNLAFMPAKALLMDLIPISEHRALQWTMVNVHEVQLFEVFQNYRMGYDLLSHTFLAPEHALPYKQCRYCGRLDHDPRGKAFGKRLSFCHRTGCPSDPNPTDHISGCCYKAWRRQKDNLRVRCRELSKTPEKLTAFFLRFCAKRYQQNLKISIPIRVEKDKLICSPKRGPFRTRDFRYHADRKEVSNEEITIHGRPDSPVAQAS